MYLIEYLQKNIFKYLRKKNHENQNGLKVWLEWKIIVKLILPLMHATSDEANSLRHFWISKRPNYRTEIRKRIFQKII